MKIKTINQLSGYIDVYASIKDGKLSITEFVYWLQINYTKKEDNKIKRLRK